MELGLFAVVVQGMLVESGGMKGTQGRYIRCLGLLFFLLVVPYARAILFEATGDLGYNTNAPAGSPAYIPWQYEGQWGVYLGTPIASNFFLAAQHIGGSSCEPFILNGVTYTPVRNFDDPDTDLRIWQVAESFPTNLIAPLYTGSSEEGMTCVLIGRGTQRGSLISIAGRTNGWVWGASDEVERWGENQIAGVYTNGNTSDLLLYANFVLNPTASEGSTNECDISVGDSSGGMFVKNGATWELAGIHYTVDGPFNTNGAQAGDFNAAVVDLRGLYYKACDTGSGCWTLYPTNPFPDVAYPTQFYSTRVSTRVSWINSIITNPVPPFSVSFTATPTNGAAPLKVAFTDTSCGSITGWAWAFGDGNTSTNQNPTNTYVNAGSYGVTEVVSGPGGSSTNTQPDYITVSAPPPVASFMANPTDGAAPLTVNFTDGSSGSVTGWAWVFGDGNTSISKNPSDTYLNPGSYTVQEIVSGQGGSSTDTVGNMISVYDPFVWWQRAYGVTNCAVCAGNASYTGDGMSNTNKFLAGFCPTNPAAYLHIISVATSGTNIMVTYLGASGDTNYVPGILSRTNVLDFTTGDTSGNYTNGGWQDTFQTNILGVGISTAGGEGTALGTVTNMTDWGGAASGPSRYYRVRVLLP
jgi:PKD repeat protein